MGKPPEGSSTHQQLTLLLSAVDCVDFRGGNERAGTKRQPWRSTTLKDMGIEYVKHGDTELFSVSLLTSGGSENSRHTPHVPRWFQIGGIRYQSKGNLKYCDTMIVRRIQGQSRSQSMHVTSAADTCCFFCLLEKDVEGIESIPCEGYSIIGGIV
jgi:hypothetical protein